MSVGRNAVLAVAATAILLTGLLVLVPSPAGAVQVQAPSVAVSDRAAAADGLLKTVLTATILIPEDEFVPLTYAEIRYSTGTIAFGGDGRITGTSCAATIVSIDADSSFGEFTGTTHPIVPDSNGYGYDFGAPSNVDFSNFNAGYQLGYGYGYGSASAAVTVTMVLEANDCPGGAFIPLNSYVVVNFQAVVGGDATRVFPSIPTTVLVRDPEDAFVAVGTPDSDPAILTNFNTGDLTQYGFGFTADNGDFIDGAAADNFLPLPFPAGSSFVTGLEVDFDLDLPEGVGLQINFFDQVTTGGAMSLSNPPFGIDPTALASRTGVPPAGFFSISMTGLPPGISASDAIDVRVTVDVPQAHFTGPPRLNVGTFTLLRFNDDGTLNLANSPTCVLLGTFGANYRFRCTITDFSSFAMAARTAGGGGGGTSTDTSTDTSSTSSTSTTTTTSTQTGTGTGTGTGTQTGTETGSSTIGTSGTTNPGKGKGTPGLELGLVAAALGALALVARRKL